MKIKTIHTAHKTLTLLAFSVALTLCPSTLLASKNETHIMVHTKGHIESPRGAQVDAPAALNLAANGKIVTQKAKNLNCPGNLAMDYKALRALCEANRGSGLNWDLANTSMDDWTGVSLIDGRVAGLYIDDMNLTELVPEVGDLKELIHLDVGGNEISTIPSTIENLSNLIIFDASDNLLAALPIEIWNLSNLRVLKIGNNALEKLPPELGKLGHLKHLYINGNALKHLPIEIGNLNKLDLLDISNNRFATFPAGVLKLTGLSFLDLTNNSLQKIPFEIEVLTDLHQVYLASNKLSTLPDNFGSFTRLIIFELEGNPLVALPSRVCDQDPVLDQAQIDAYICQ